jgi:hypothetical protein
MHLGTGYSSRLAGEAAIQVADGLEDQGLHYAQSHQNVP